jgi:hypothetical protein
MPRQWRRTPYYKVQVFNATFQSWKDERKIFDTAEEARAYISEAFPEAQARIIVVHRDHRYVLDEGSADQ